MPILLDMSTAYARGVNRSAVPTGAAVSGAGRAARAIAVALITVPAMLAAHLATAGDFPPPHLVAGVTAIVAVVAAAVTSQRRWMLAVGVGLAQAAGHVVLAILTPSADSVAGRGCLSAVGRGAEIGLRLALLRHDATCPSGALTAGPATVATVATVLAAVLVLVGHAAIALLASALVVAVHTVVRVAAAVAGLRLTCSAPRPLVHAPRRLAASPAAERPAGPLWRPRPTALRGPPPINA